MNSNVRNNQGDTALKCLRLGMLSRLSSYQYQGKFNQARSVKDKEETKLTQEIFWQNIADCVLENSIVIAETGTSLFGALTIPLADGTQFIGQGLWGSIGYALGALLGAKLAAPEKQVIVFIGDGSFQLTAQELATLLRHQLNPFIFLLNNEGYTMRY
jgi:TPP-dependent 2-oxoacid decarboxylase